MRYVAYYRVSTRRQNESRLGLDWQIRTVHDFVEAGGGTLIAELAEVKTGRTAARSTFARRPKLKAALELCEKHEATLVTATLDRLARNLAFLSALMESRTGFVVANASQLTPLMLHVYGALAQEEARKTSARTRAALAAAKARGRKLGRTMVAMAERRVREAEERAEELRPIVDEIIRQGSADTVAIQQDLNRRRVPTVKGGPWSYMSTNALLMRLAGRYDRYAPMRMKPTEEKTPCARPSATTEYRRRGKVRADWGSRRSDKE